MVVILFSFLRCSAVCIDHFSALIFVVLLSLFLSLKRMRIMALKNKKIKCFAMVFILLFLFEPYPLKVI